MANKRKTTSISDMLFDEVDPYGAVIGQPVSKPIERFPLSAIRPDLDQPRHLLPPDLARAVSQGEMVPAVAMREWIKRDTASARPTLTQDLRELRRLATAIEQHGLINPITIRPSDFGEDRYIIVTGERRYWAHVLLELEQRQIKEGDMVLPPDQIKAVLVAPGVSIRAHQIVENLMREDINVVEKAHGLWALRRELSDDAHGRHHDDTHISNDAHGRHSESETSPSARLVPWKQVETALDISRQYRARIVAVLEMSEESQALVDQYDLSERTIRPIVEKLKAYPDLQVQALRQLIAWEEAEAQGETGGRRIVPSVEALVDKLLAIKESSSVGEARPAPGLDFGKFHQKVRGTLRYMQKLDETALTELTRTLDQDNATEIVVELQALRKQIDEMLHTLEGNDS